MAQSVRTDGTGGTALAGERCRAPPYTKHATCTRRTEQHAKIAETKTNHTQLPASRPRVGRVEFEKEVGGEETRRVFWRGAHKQSVRV